MLSIVTALVSFLVLAIGAVLLGARIRPQHVAVVRARYSASPATVWTLVSDPLSAQSWRTELDGVERAPSPEGVLRWRERSRRRVVEFEALPSIEGRHFATRIAQDDLPFAGQWDYDLSPDGAGTSLVITERGEIRPALFRLLAHYGFGYTHSLEAFHRSLAARLGEQIQIEILQDGR